MRKALNLVLAGMAAFTVAFGANMVADSGNGEPIACKAKSACTCACNGDKAACTGCGADCCPCSSCGSGCCGH